MLLNYLTIALRNLLRHRAFSFLNIFGLTIGLAASVLILLWVQNELNFDQYHRYSERIYRVTNTFHSGSLTWDWSGSPSLLGELAQQQISEVEQITRSQAIEEAITFRINQALFNEKNVAYVDSNWFEFFDYQFIAGNPKTVFKDPYSIVLTETEARRYFGIASAAMGKIIQLDSINLVVQAVLKDNPANSSFQYGYLLPIALKMTSPVERKNSQTWDRSNYQLFIRLRVADVPNRVSSKLTAIYRDYKKDSSTTTSLLPLKGLHFSGQFSSEEDELPKGDQKTVIILGMMGMLILITACINYVNLTTARASTRAKEIGIKKIIGAGRGRLFVQFLTESALLAIISLVLAIFLVELSLPYFNNFTERHFSLNFTNSSVWLMLLGTVITTILLSGIYPALLLSSFRPLSVLRGSNLLGTKTTTFRQSLVLLQFVISISLLFGTLVIYRQLQYVRTHNPGYEREHIIQVPIAWHQDWKRVVNARLNLEERLAELSGVRAVSAASGSIVEVRSATMGFADWEGRPANFDVSLWSFSVEKNFQEVFQLKMKQGRWFNSDWKADSANIILNLFWLIPRPLGRFLLLGPGLALGFIPID